ncbi:MAG TPA: ABC transporter permease [Baekduia sp.]|uniref:ABC transporter permease n=1 Tax=Baekduia sp. TaxID=2600305 RepID=UPI002CB984C1|nr:ABC transporter permease [Baekduia sp.]HMJ36283.1 ABC transporter permease [Baekduia sp.]
MSGARKRALTPARLRAGDVARVAGVGLRTRPLRAGLSALGIAIGVAAIVAVLGLSSSSQAGLLAEIDRLGTNLLTASKGQTFAGEEAQLPTTATRMIGGVAGVQDVADTATLPGVKVFRSPLISSAQTNGLVVQAASLDLLPIVATRVAQGRWLDAAIATEPVVVLGAAAAERMGVDRVVPGDRVWLGGQWFTVAGILAPAVLAPEIDTSALVGYPAARRYLHYTSTVGGRVTSGPPTTVYVRADTARVEAVQGLLAQTANPEAPNEVDVSQPSSALTARAAAKSATNSLFLGLGAVALLVGAVGVANIMIIAVLERRSEIGLRRALGATRGQIRTQFLVEAIVLALLGGAVGVGLGALATAVYADVKGWAVVIPASAWAGGMGAAVAIGAVAGLAPALRAARLSPTEALRTV